MNECTKKVRVITLASYTDSLKILLLWAFLYSHFTTK